jgi:nucleotide-binding universal stress UspA family protein
MYSRILVAVDGSDTSQHALTQAIDLAKGLSAMLRIVHVVDMGLLPAGPELAVDIEAISAARRFAGEKVIAAAGETSSKNDFAAETGLLETETPTQHVAETIAGEATRWQADLVVLGTHGRRGFQRLLLGSVAEQMTRRSTVPVLLIPSSKV